MIEKITITILCNIAAHHMYKKILSTKLSQFVAEIYEDNFDAFSS